MQRLVDETVDACGRIDVFVNNAGLGGTAPLAEMTDEQWSTVLDVTLTGTMRMTRAALRHMYERGSGAIVNNASVVGWRAQAGQSHYAAAKAGVMALTRCAAIEAAEHRRARATRSRRRSRCTRTSPRSRPRSCSPELTTREAFGRAAEPRRGRQRDRVPRQRPRVVHDRRGRLRQQPAPVKNTVCALRPPIRGPSARTRGGRRRVRSRGRRRCGRPRWRGVGAARSPECRRRGCGRGQRSRR